MNLPCVIVPFAFLALLAMEPSPPPVPSDWLARVRELTFTSQSGDSAGLARAMGGFARTFPPGAPPWVEYDRTNGLLLICMWPSANHRCEHSVYVRAADAGVPNGAVPATLSAPAIGMTLEQLLARFKKDPNLASKSLTNGAHGDVVMVSALDEYPGPREYDHGMQTYSYQLYLLRDGIVVAAASQYAEN